MSFVRRIKYFLVHTAGFTNKQASKIIKAGEVKINGNIISENVFLEDEDEISVNNKIVRERKEHTYIKFYKPPGFQSTLNKNVPDSLCEFFKSHKGLSIAGRLDKASEGLLLLSTNGKWVERIVNPANEKEKEYFVRLDRKPDENYTKLFSAGILLADGITKPCKCEIVNEKEIKVVLTEGRNRQIRRMCHKLGYGVTRLLRTRIDKIELKDLKPGETEIFTLTN